MGALGGLIASRVAREFRVGGPSFTVSSEETSGLRALDVAVRLLRQNELDEAVVAAVDLTGDPRATVAAARSGVARLTRGDGAAAVVLKRLDDAVRDGDRVYALIRGLGAATGRDIDPSGTRPTPRPPRHADGPTTRRVASPARGGPRLAALLERSVRAWSRQGSATPARRRASPRWSRLRSGSTRRSCRCSGRGRPALLAPRPRRRPPAGRARSPARGRRDLRCTSSSKSSTGADAPGQPSSAPSRSAPARRPCSRSKPTTRRA